MTIRWTEEEAKAFGCRKDKKGNWEPPKGFDQRNPTVSKTRDSRAVSKSKRSVRKRSKAKDKTQGGGEGQSEASPQFRIEVTSYRKRDTDPDNLCPKWYIDEIVRAGLIPDDSSKYIKEVVKRVIVSKEEPKTVIEVFRLNGINE